MGNLDITLVRRAVMRTVFVLSKDSPMSASLDHFTRSKPKMIYLKITWN